MAKATTNLVVFIMSILLLGVVILGFTLVKLSLIKLVFGVLIRGLIVGAIAALGVAALGLALNTLKKSVKLLVGKVLTKSYKIEAEVESDEVLIC